MGLLQEGQWVDRWYETKSTGGRFVRTEAQFRNWITADGTTGPSGEAGFKAEVGRYHLYVSLACPWAHRAVIFRALKGLESMISLSVVHWYMGDQGWSFEAGPGVIADPCNQANFMHQVYTAANPLYSGRVTVPVLWDKSKKTIVSNESSEIIRMFNQAFDDQGAKPGDFYPQHVRASIDEINALVYNRINNGVYKAGFATSQSAYEEAVIPLFETLEALEERLGDQPYLCGSDITEADWRLFTTLVRFDPVYVGHFKCNLKRLVDFPNLWAYVQKLHAVPGVEQTLNMEHIKRHYYESHPTINPAGVVPLGPKINFTP